MEQSRAAMKIAYYVPSWPAATAGNGISTYVDNISVALRARGHECFVIAPSAVGEAGPEFRPLAPADSALMARARRRLASLLLTEEVEVFLQTADRIAEAVNRLDDEVGLDVLEIEESFGWASRVRERVRIPVIVRLHGPHFRDAGAVRSNERIAREGAAIACADGVSSPSGALLDLTLRHYDCDRGFVAAIANPSPTAPPAGRWSLARAEPKRIVFVGRFDDRKGADIMLEAFAQALKTDRDLELVLIGADAGVPDAMTGESLKYAQYASRRLAPEVAARVDFRGRTPRPVADDFRRSAGVVVLASRSETFPYALVEALSLGCPVVSTRTFGPPETLLDGEEALLVELGDAAGLCDAILRVISDEALAKRLSQNGVAAAARDFSPDVIAGTTEAFYREVALGRAGRASAAG